MKAPLKKILIARYVLYLEVLGFLIMGTIIAGMIYCVIAKIDDSCAVKTDKVTGLVEPVTLAKKAYIDKVQASAGSEVKKGQVILSSLQDTVDVSIMEAKMNLASSADAILALSGKMAENANSSSVTLAVPSASKNISVPADVLQSVSAAKAGSQAIKPTSQPESVTAAVDGMLIAPDLEKAAGTIKEGKVGEVHNFSVLRFSVPAGGKNADRVGISLMGPRDILDWKKVTKVMKSEEAPESTAKQRIWALSTTDANKEALKFVGEGKVPDDAGKGTVVALLNGMLRMKDFYDGKSWATEDLSEEAKSLIAKGADKLTENELYRLNRLLMEAALPEEIEKSKNEQQKVKAKILIAQPSKMVDGKEKKVKPVVYELTGKILGDKDATNSVMVELYDPPTELQEELKKRLTQTGLTPISMTGNIVVGQIRMFQFLFSKN